jgi:hypothetical protein
MTEVAPAPAAPRETKQSKIGLEIPIGRVKGIANRHVNLKSQNETDDTAILFAGAVEELVVYLFEKCKERLEIEGDRKRLMPTDIVAEVQLDEGLQAMSDHLYPAPVGPAFVARKPKTPRPPKEAGADAAAADAEPATPKKKKSPKPSTAKRARKE